MSTITEISKTMQDGPAPESPAAANAWLDEQGRRFGLFINTRWDYPQGAEFYTSYNPATGEKLAETAQAGQMEVDAAVAAARPAFPTLGPTPRAGRARRTGERR